MRVISKLGLQCGAVFRGRGPDLSSGPYRQRPVPRPRSILQSSDFSNCSGIVFLPRFDLFLQLTCGVRWWSRRWTMVSFGACAFPTSWLCLCVSCLGEGGREKRGSLVSGATAGSATTSAGLRWVTAVLRIGQFIACVPRALCESPSLVIEEGNTRCK